MNKPAKPFANVPSIKPNEPSTCSTQCIPASSNTFQDGVMRFGATPKNCIAYDDYDGLWHLVAIHGPLLFLSRPIETKQDESSSILRRGISKHFYVLLHYIAHKLYENNNVKSIRANQAPYNNKITLVLDEIVNFSCGGNPTTNQRAAIRRGIKKALEELDALRYRLLNDKGELVDNLIRYPLSAMESNWTRNGTLELTFNSDFLDFYFKRGCYTPVSAAILGLNNLTEMKIITKIIDAYTRSNARQNNHLVKLKIESLLSYCGHIPRYEDVKSTNGNVGARIMTPTVHALNSLIEQGFITIEKMKLNNQHMEYDGNRILGESYKTFSNVTLYITVDIIKDVPQLA